MRECFKQWKINGHCEYAKELNQTIGESYFDTANPHFFTGDFNSDIVLVHLNPKRNQNNWGQECKFTDFNEYMEFYSSFGSKSYGINSKRTHKSQFDHKQIRFLKPFNILPFKNEDIYHNLETVIDKKLQLELVPFGSPDFSYHKIGIDNLEPYILRLIDVLASRDRTFIIFCGRVFTKILSKYLVDKKHYEFKLTKKDGNPTKANFEVINIKLNINNSELTACIAPQYAKQGYPVSEYGKEIFNRYGSF